MRYMHVTLHMQGLLQSMRVGAVTNRLVAKRPFESLEVCARTEPIDLEENVTHAD